MQIRICAVGRLRSGPEKQLVDDYLTRFARNGRALGFPAIDVVEIDERKARGMAGEADLLRAALPKGAALIILDERGKVLSSPNFAQRLSTFRDTGRDVALVIGGVDGIDPALRAEADLAISLGQMVWPHMLVRVMLAEQLYRAVTILSGSPYHRV